MDKKITRISATSILAVLLVILFVPLGESVRIVTAAFLLPVAVIIPNLIKKRSILSINKNQVLLIMTVFALVCVMIYYLTGFAFGFYKNPYALSVKNLFTFILPIAAIIICTEIVRSVFVAQGDKLSTWICYLFCTITDMLIVSNIPAISSFNRFMDLVAGAMLPALIANLLYNYLSKRYGAYPNVSYRLITTLYAYIFTVSSGIKDSLVSFFKLIIPIAIYLFIDSLYEKKKKYALENKSRFWLITSRTLTVLVLTIMIGLVMLVSNQFKYGSLVVATESMTGEINKGDVVIFESYDGQVVEEGQVIVFERNRSMIVHRVVDIEIINGVARYYTKGDANEDKDYGYITSADIVGLADFKIPLVGYPTLWVRSLFKH